jgi:hypothetical protein
VYPTLKRGANQHSASGAILGQELLLALAVNFLFRVRTGELKMLF